MRALQSIAALGVTSAAALSLAACGNGTIGDRTPNVIAGKRAFVEKCGSCHVLNRAGSQGITGPNLDESFRQALADGMQRSTVRGVVQKQIHIPNRRKQIDPATGQELQGMPADLVEGDLAFDVAAYVASVAARRGEDQGRLADIGAATATETTEAKNGLLSIPANPDGQLVYQFASATAPAGSLEIESKNDASIEHDIAIEGNGVNAKGEPVKSGGVSKFSVDLQPGEYTFYCSLPGHREGGMEGKLTVK